ncbi:hypothetical protein ABZ606_10735 [Streptomyces sp. NPDC012461]|jgi:hypothetical protein|uniref:hypothetical protein n=1 Tax=unclassified Streptomyces TaxID=2593676 RepID=UPI0013DA0C76|nr:hypothetical protein [Streptomyces sp. SID9913]MBM7091497.1 hypothetical protein [Streptomyces sp. S12]NED16766.1 hypothetical protein [Streptomyces sp. SID9913]
MPAVNPQQNHGGRDHTDHDGFEDPDAGKDFSHLIPAMSVGWDVPPSFNLDPETGSGTGSTSKEVADSGPILFDARTVRSTENALLAESRNAVSGYEALRARVDAVVHTPAFWGPPPPDAPIAAMTWASATPNSGYYQSEEDRDRQDQQVLADIGEEFARHIAPAMQKALSLQSNSLALLGNLIAMINRAGQSYSKVDRAARFPDPQGTLEK